MIPPTSTLGGAIAQSFRLHVLDESVARIRRCTELLSTDDCWRKTTPHGNSVANLVIHLEGNVRQWILAGVAGREDQRDRPREFAAAQNQVDASVGRLVDRLEATVREAVVVVESLDDSEWLAPRRFQGRYEGSVASGVIHALEHFSGHAGQIYAFTKQTLDTDLGFYANL